MVGMMMILLTSSIMMFSLSPSPLKMSLFLTYTSVCMSFFCYKITMSVFTPMVVMISFSSGMMILFSYCSVMCLHKEKSFQSKPTILMVTLLMIITPMILSTHSMSQPTPMMKSMTETINNPSLMFLMFMVILAMVGINISFFNPTKKFMKSY